MTPEESVAAYQNYCASSKGFNIQWKEAGIIKVFKCHTTTVAVAKVAEVIPIAEDTHAISINRVDLAPTFEGYLEWLAQNPGT